MSLVGMAARRVRKIIAWVLALFAVAAMAGGLYYFATVVA